VGRGGETAGAVAAASGGSTAAGLSDAGRGGSIDSTGVVG
jgi:hypothetical protein